MVKLKTIPKAKIQIDDLILEMEKDKEYVKKAVFKTDIGEINWRANIPTGVEEKNGFKVEAKTKKKPTLDELPEILYLIRDNLEKGPVIVETSYRQWDYGDKISYTLTYDQITSMTMVEQKPKKIKK